MSHFKEREFRKIIFFSDGAPSQYKNKSSFADLSFYKDEFGYAKNPILTAYINNTVTL